MTGTFRALGRALRWIFATRALRPFAVLGLALWLLDGAIRVATDAAWFGSVGMGGLWRAEFVWKWGVASLFALVCLALSIPVMRAVARPVASEVEEPPLPRALLRFALMRARATRWGWAALLVAALWEAHLLGEGWSRLAWALAPLPRRAGDFWLVWAPALEALLAGAWGFGLVLGAVALLAGTLRALPFLAARPAASPVHWLRAQTVVGAALCTLRALGFAFEAARAQHAGAGGDVARMGVLFIGGAGALGCLALAVQLWRPRLRALAGTVAVVVLAALLGDAFAPSVRGDEALPPMSKFALADGAPNGAPLLDERLTLRAARARLGRDDAGHLVEWQTVGVGAARADGHTQLNVVGVPVVTDAWAGHGTADEGTLAWSSLDFPRSAPSRGGQPVGPLFYGLSGRPLLAERLGAPFQSRVWKMAWAWRLRDPLLPFEGARAKTLLVWRGAREAGQTIAPFWVWDEAVPRRDARTGSAFWECVAYDMEMVRPVAVLRMDAQTGALRVAPFEGAGAPVARWRAALPSLFGARAPQSVPTPALQTALAGGAPLVWMRDAHGWEARATTPALRPQIEAKLRAFAVTARAQTHSTPEAGTPILWGEGGRLLLARPFFRLPPESSSAGEVRLPVAVGMAAGPLEADAVRWSEELPGSGAALSELAHPAALLASAPRGAITRAASPPAKALAQAALAETQAATRALQAGRYVGSQAHMARAQALLGRMAESSE